GGGVVFPDQGEGILPAIRDAQDVERVLGAGFAPLLIEYARAREKGESARRPWFLEPPTAQHHLMALSVLCQGYMVAHVPSEWVEPGVLKEALERLGWNALIGSASGRALAKQVAGKAKLTEETGWWSKVLGDGDLHSTLRKEWGESERCLFTDSVARLA